MQTAEEWGLRSGPHPWERWRSPVNQCRISPLDPPYDEKTQELFDLVMPPGKEPLNLFRTLATNRRIFPRFMRAGVLDRGPVPILDRELVIQRTTARCGSEYEWGVHVTAFARPLQIPNEIVAASVTAAFDDPLWTPRQSVLIRLCDELHDTGTIADELWEALEAHFNPQQIVELIYLVGMYHTVSFLANGLQVELEEDAERFPGQA